MERLRCTLALNYFGNQFEFRVFAATARDVNLIRVIHIIRTSLECETRDDGKFKTQKRRPSTKLLRYPTCSRITKRIWPAYRLDHKKFAAKLSFCWHLNLHGVDSTAEEYDLARSTTSHYSAFVYCRTALILRSIKIVKYSAVFRKRPKVLYFAKPV